MLTHPDKLEGINNAAIVDNLISQYRIAIDAYQTNDYANLIMIADELNLRIPKSAIDRYITPSIERIEKKVSDLTKTLAYSWYHIPEDKRFEEFKHILEKFGFCFDEEEALEVIKRVWPPPARKKGERPKNFIKTRKDMIK